MEQAQAKLAELLPLLRSGDIEAIEFGRPETPLSFMSHHRIMHIQTLDGVQFVIKLIHAGMLGSGIYLGDLDDSAIIQSAMKLVERYMRPSPNPAIRAYMEKRNKDRRQPEYFAIAHPKKVAA